MSWEERDLVEAGYDHMAEGYLRAKDPADPFTFAALERAATTVPSARDALDLGCGAGVPATTWLVERYAVTGVDISARQLDLARERVPDARLVKASMTEVAFDPASFDIVVALYSIIHVRREEQPELLRRIHSWLRPGGVFLATWAVHAWEGQEDDWEGWGAPMWWSHHDAGTNRAMLQAAGFNIVWDEIAVNGGETGLWVLAQTALSVESS